MAHNTKREEAGKTPGPGDRKDAGRKGSGTPDMMADRLAAVQARHSILAYKEVLRREAGDAESQFTYEIGRQAGKAFIESLARESAVLPGKEGLLQALAAFSKAGFGQFTAIHPNWETGRVEIACTGGFESEAALGSGSPAGRSVCDYTRGALEAIVSEILRREAPLPADFQVVEPECRARGHTVCRFVLGSAAELIHQGYGSPEAAPSLRQQLEAQVLSQSEVIHPLFEIANDAILVGEFEGPILMANERAVKWFGYSLEEFPTLSLKNLLTDESEALFGECIRRLQREGRCLQDLEFRRKDKSTFVGQLSGSLQWQVGQPRRVFAIIRDITDIERLRQHLEESESLYRTLVERSVVGVYLVQDGLIQYANRALLDMTGYGYDELVGHSPTRHVLPNDQGLIEEMEARGLAGDAQDLRYCIRWISRSGKVGFFEVWGSVVHYRGRPAIQGIVIDMTDKEKQAQRLSALSDISRAINAQLELERVFNETLAQVEPIIEADLSAVLVFNPDEQTARVAATGPKSPDASFLDGPHTDFGDSPLFRQAAGGKLAYEPNIQKGGSELERQLAEAGYRSLALVPTSSEAECPAILVAAWRKPAALSPADLVFLRAVAQHLAIAIKNSILYQQLRKAYEELKTAQDHQIQAEKLHALGQMASGIAHDLNNSLSAVIGFTELALEQKSLEKAREYLGRSLHEAQQVISTVRRIQEFSRRGPTAEELESLDPNVLVQDIINLTQHRWKDIPQQKGIVINVKTALQPVRQILGVASELRECLTSLVFNAVEAMPQGGTLTFKTLEQEGFSVISISDTGVGMTSDTAQRIFDPFFTTKGVAGTGLGLSITYSTIKRHGGDIRVTTEPGKGTTFLVRLPASAIVQEAPEVTAEIVIIKPVKVLIIDDQPVVREAIRLILERDDHIVVEAGNGMEGIARFNSEPFDIVLTDLGMPEMSGAEVAQIIHAKNPQIPILLVTGWGDIVNEQEMKQYGIISVVPKPVRINQLRNLLCMIFGARQLQ
ncbi:MAG: PAS domain S-box protein [bacterium]